MDGPTGINTIWKSFARGGLNPFPYACHVHLSIEMDYVFCLDSDLVFQCVMMYFDISCQRLVRQRAFLNQLPSAGGCHHGPYT